jgi:hypothetical protein
MKEAIRVAPAVDMLGRVGVSGAHALRGRGQYAREEMDMRIAVIALGVALMIVGVVPGQIGAQALDSQSLIGEWTGKWVQQSAGTQTQGRRFTPSGAYRLVINKVEGRVVFADIYFEGAQGASEREARGTLEGNTLTFGPTRFAVSGNEMRGNRSTPSIEINLTKLK